VKQFRLGSPANRTSGDEFHAQVSPLKIDGLIASEKKRSMPFGNKAFPVLGEMLLHGFGIRERRIAEFQLCDREGAPSMRNPARYLSPFELVMTVCSRAPELREK